MSRRDLVAELRIARPEVPPEVRERVRAVVASAEPPRSRFTRSRAFLIAVPTLAAAAAVTAAVLATRPTQHPDQRLAVDHGVAATRTAQPPRAQARKGTFSPSLHTVGTALDAGVPAPAVGRAQRYNAFLALRLHSANAVSNAVKRALRTTTALGGYAVSVHVSAERRNGSADLVVKVPRTHIREAVARLSQLGTIVGERVDVQDLQGGINATGRTIARLQRRLRALRAEPQSKRVTRQIASVTAHVEALQRASAATVRGARYATVELTLSTPPRVQPVPKSHHHGPLHGLGVAFRWLGIGLVYAGALGGVALAIAAAGWFAIRAVRRRRVEALLSRP